MPASYRTDRRSACLIAFVALSFGSIAIAAEPAASTTPSADELRFFESEVRPLLAARCFKCHGPDKQNGGLRLDHHADLLKGGETGPAIVPGKPAESLLIEAINYRTLEMPPKGKLSESEIALLTRWIELGAFWPTEDSQPELRAADAGQLTDADRAYWAFQPPRAVEPPDAGESNWPRTDVDRFILAKLATAGLAPSPEAGRVTLIRRVTQDVTGLPPTVEEIDAFVSDPSPDAYERLVDRLLESPRYGEHQARMWLDLVRYAESDGYKQDAYRPSAWRYRDYVVQSFNNDKPYTQFLTEQLAGDEVDPTNSDAIIAAGFFRHGIYEYNQRDVRGQWRDIQIDITDTVGDVFLAMSVGCARCHDHKFDPILQKDYYRLQAFFAGLSFENRPAASPQDQEQYWNQQSAWAEQTADVRARIDDFTRDRFATIGRNVIGKFSPDLQEVWNRPADQRQPGDEPLLALMQWQIDEEINNFPKTLKGDDKDQWDRLQAELNGFRDRRPADLPEARSVSEFGPTSPAVFIPDKARLGAVEPGFLSAIDEAPAEITPLPGSRRTTGRRAALARWLTQPDHPLTARIIVNRIWQMHFGRGLVETPSDFGRLSGPPSHPELLDWLAVNFVRNGSRLKWLHRELLTSAAYRQKSAAPEAGRDPGNRWLASFPIRRLTAEQVRDAALAASGELDLTAGGESSELAQPRRAIYTRVIRNRRDPLLDVFDFPERFSSVGARHATTTPTQSLFLINGDWMLDRASHFAERLTREVPGGEDSRVRLAYRLAFGREATLPEIERGVEFLYERRAANPAAPEDRPPIDEALVDFCHVLLNANEFFYLD